MEPYAVFAQYYDAFMGGIFFDRWKQYVSKLFEEMGFQPRSMVDLGCGTGTVAVDFAGEGIDVQGLDASKAMIREAREKTSAEGLSCRFSMGDMRDFLLPEPVDLITCNYDSLNYLLTAREIQQVFGRVRRHLRPGGLFVFDLNTPYGLKTEFPMLARELEGGECYLAWTTRYISRQGRSALTMTFFVRERDGRYRRYEEEHVERGYPNAKIIEWLRKEGLDLVAARDWRRGRRPHARSRRILYVARRSG
jgi:ubiquinone/menaquinone biosynthesis C-methylase UbiE